MCCDRGGGSAPDYSGVAAANEAAAKLGYKAASERLAFDKETRSEAAPYVKNLAEEATKSAKSQNEIAADNLAHGREQWTRYQDVFQPQEDKMVRDANEYDSEQRKEQVAGRAMDAVKTQAEQQQKGASRRLIAMGVNPASGKYGKMATATAIDTAAATAGAGNKAIESVDDKAIGLRAGVANFGRNNPNTAASAFGTSIAAGNSATGNYSAAANSGLPSAALVDGGYGQMQSAANTGVQSALGFGQILNTGYGIQSAADSASSAGFGKMVGGLAGAAGAYFSSKKLKHGMKPVNGDDIVDRIAAVPVEEWVYNDGVADSKKHVGPYAEDMQDAFGDVVAPGGNEIDVISAIGVNQAATSAIAKRLKVLEGAIGIRKHS